MYPELRFKPACVSAVSDDDNDDDGDDTAKSTTGPESSTVTSPENPDKDNKYLANTILHKPDMHSLLAQTINKAISNQSDDGQQVDMQKSLIELIDERMCTIMEPLETDPLFKQLIDELIEGRTDIPDCTTDNAHSAPVAQSDHATAQQVPEAEAPAAADENAVAGNEDPANNTMTRRLRPRKEGPRLSALIESPKRPYTKRRSKNVDITPDNQIKIISNEPFTGPLPEVMLQDNQGIVYVINTDGTTASINRTTNGNVFLNAPQFMIAPSSSPSQAMVPSLTTSISFGDDMSMLLQPSMCLTTNSSLNPGTIINTSDLQTPIVVSNNVGRHENAISSMKSPMPAEHVVIVVDGDTLEPDTEAMPVASAADAGATIPLETIMTTATATEEGSGAATTTTKTTFMEKKFITNTPKQPVNQSIQASSRCQSTPRHRSTHVRVLDFNTPIRLKMQAAKIVEEEMRGKYFIDVCFDIRSI